MTTQPVLYVDYGETVADIAMREKASNSLVTTTSIIVGVLLLLTFFANSFLVATIFTSYKLRNKLLYLIFAQLGVLNLIECCGVTFVSLMYIANTNWVFGDFTCRLNACLQTFAELQSFFTIMLACVERAFGLSTDGQQLLTRRYMGSLSLLFAAVSLCLSSPALFPGFPVAPYPYRYLCAAGPATPLPYTVIQMVVYGGCLFVMTLCFGAIARYKRSVSESRSLPARPQDYGQFIMESRALQDYMQLSRLVFSIFVAFLVFQGPYIILNFFVQIRNSAQFLATQEELEVAQDVDTLITFLMVFYPLICTVLIYCTCEDVWCKLINLAFCRRSTGIPYGNWNHNHRTNSALDESQSSNNVLTVVATTDGIQIKGPNGQFASPPTLPTQPSAQPKKKSKLAKSNLNDQKTENGHNVRFYLPNQLPDQDETKRTENRTKSILNPTIFGPNGTMRNPQKASDKMQLQLDFDSSLGSDKSSDKSSRIPLSSRMKERNKRKTKTLSRAVATRRRNMVVQKK